jgi:formylmethanofuran:tetrahydromethanopterin formyltransferase
VLRNRKASTLDLHSVEAFPHHGKTLEKVIETAVGFRQGLSTIYIFFMGATQPGAISAAGARMRGYEWM